MGRLLYICNKTGTIATQFGFSSDAQDIGSLMGRVLHIKNDIATLKSYVSTIGGYVNTMKGYLYDIHEVLANETDAALKNAQEDNVAEATSDFFSGSASSTSIGTGTIRSVKGSFGDAQSFFGMGEGIDVFGSLSDQSSSGPWIWFTQSVKEDLSSVQQTRDEVYIDFLTPKYDDLYSRLGGEDDGR